MCWRVTSAVNCLCLSWLSVLLREEKTFSKENQWKMKWLKILTTRGQKNGKLKSTHSREKPKENIKLRFLFTSWARFFVGRGREMSSQCSRTWGGFCSLTLRKIPMLGKKNVSHNPRQQCEFSRTLARACSLVKRCHGFWREKVRWISSSYLEIASSRKFRFGHQQSRGAIFPWGKRGAINYYPSHTHSPLPLPSSRC